MDIAIDKEKFAERFKALRREKGYSQEKIARELGTKRGTIAAWEAGHRIPELSKAYQAAELFDVSTDYLLGRTDDSASLDEIIRRTGGWHAGKMVRVPILGEIRAGKPMYAEENISGWIEVSEEELRGGEFFFLRIKGDSMVGSRIFDGSVVKVRRQDWIENGEVAVVIVNDGEATIKRVRYVDGMVILYADNPNYKAQVYPADEVKILGLVLEARHDVK